MPSCIYHKVDFDNASAEHVLQNFLGARWESDRIICDQLQKQFSTTVDKALEVGLQPIRNLFGTRGGRGEPGPPLRGLPVTSGELVDLSPGAVPRLNEPVVNVAPRPDGRHDVRISLGHLGQLGWALSKLRAQVPNLQVDQQILQQIARPVEAYLTGSVRLEISLGGREYFRGALKSCFNLLGVIAPDLALDAAFDPVRRFVLTGEGDMGDFVRWMNHSNPLPVPRLGDADQFIGIVTRGSSVEGVVQFFGDVVHPFRLAVEYRGPEVRAAYVVDPFREASPAEQRNPEFDSNAVPVFSSQSPENTPMTQAVYGERIRRIAAHFYDREYRRIVDDTLRQVLEPHMGSEFTEELSGRVSDVLAQRLSRRG